MGERLSWVIIDCTLTFLHKILKYIYIYIQRMGAREMKKRQSERERQRQRERERERERVWYTDWVWYIYIEWEIILGCDCNAFFELLQLYGFLCHNISDIHSLNHTHM